MTDVAKKRLTTALAVFLIAAGATAWLFSVASSDPAPHLVELRNGLVLALLVLCALAIALWSLSLLLAGPRALRLAGLQNLIALAGLTGWSRYYTDIGVLALGGAGHWVAEAANAETVAHKRAYLRSVLSATQYGVNAAENAVLEHPPSVQAELFTLLAELVGPPHWRDRCRHLASEARGS